jgi:hypothetical protein
MTAAILTGSEATTALEQLAAERNIEIIEFSPSDLRRQLDGWYTEFNGRSTFVFPQGQDPVERLTRARQLIAHVERTA